MPDAPTPDPLYAFIANGSVLFTRQFAKPPGTPDWLPVVSTDAPKFDPETQELASAGWTLTGKSATHAWVVLERAKPDAEVVLVAPEEVTPDAPIELPAVADLLKGATQQIDPKISALFVALADELGLNQEQIDRVFEKVLAK